jgi:hypothetical protein
MGDGLASGFSYPRRRRLAGKRAVRLSDSDIKKPTGDRKRIKRKYYAQCSVLSDKRREIRALSKLFRKHFCL